MPRALLIPKCRSRRRSTNLPRGMHFYITFIVTPWLLAKNFHQFRDCCEYVGSWSLKICGSCGDHGAEGVVRCLIDHHNINPWMLLRSHDSTITYSNFQNFQGVYIEFHSRCFLRRLYYTKFYCLVDNLTIAFLGAEVKLESQGSFEYTVVLNSPNSKAATVWISPFATLTLKSLHSCVAYSGIRAFSVTEQSHMVPPVPCWNRGSDYPGRPDLGRSDCEVVSRDESMGVHCWSPCDSCDTHNVTMWSWKCKAKAISFLLIICQPCTKNFGLWAELSYGVSRWH